MKLIAPEYQIFIMLSKIHESCLEINHVHAYNIKANQLQRSLLQPSLTKKSDRKPKIHGSSINVQADQSKRRFCTRHPWRRPPQTSMNHHRHSEIQPHHPQQYLHSSSTPRTTRSQQWKGIKKFRRYPPKQNCDHYFSRGKSN